MADRVPSTTRRALLGAAAALPLAALPTPVRPERVEGRPLPSPADKAAWTECLTRYRRLFARAKAAAEIGWFRAANDRFNRESTTPGTDGPTAFARISRAEDLYWRRCTEPLQEAAEALVLTPAPDLEALQDKLAVIRAHQLHEEGSMERDCIEVIEEDVGRLNR